MARTCRDDLPDGESEIFFETGLDRQIADLPVGQKIAMQGGLVAIISALARRHPRESEEPVHTNARVCWIPAFRGDDDCDSRTQANYL